MKARAGPVSPDKALDNSGRSFTASIGPRSLFRSAAVAGCLAAAGCSTPLAVQSRYAGDMQGCMTGPRARATLVRQSDRFSFAPSDGALVISGNMAPDGSFSGSLVANPARHDHEDHSGTGAPPFTLTVTGRIEGGVAIGTYASPRCSAGFRLPRIEATLLP